MILASSENPTGITWSNSAIYDQSLAEFYLIYQKHVVIFKHDLAKQ